MTGEQQPQPSISCDRIRQELDDVAFELAALDQQGVMLKELLLKEAGYDDEMVAQDPRLNFVMGKILMAQGTVSRLEKLTAECAPPTAA